MKNSRLSLDKIQQQKNPEHNILESAELNFAAENRGPMIIDAINPEELVAPIQTQEKSTKKKDLTETPNLDNMAESTEIIDG